MAARLSATFALAALTVVPALAACASKGPASAGPKVAIAATDSTCTVERTTLDAGPTTFAVTNKGSKTTEVYVYGGDGTTFTKIVGEVENVGPGTSRDLKTDLAAGTYEVACKPGQQGDGIRSRIDVSGASAAPKAAGRDVQFSTRDFAYDGIASLRVQAGETIKFELTNKGPARHEFEVLGPDGSAVGEIGPTTSGSAGDVTITFAKAGTYTYQCGIDDHKARGMTGTFTVT